MSPTYIGGVQQQTPLALGLLAALLVLHVLGLVDDRKPLGPYVKLFVQLAVAAIVVVGFDMRALTALDVLRPRAVDRRSPSSGSSRITNAFNFLDNMDGLSAGVAAVCDDGVPRHRPARSASGSSPATLALLLGALLGFLCFNFPPAQIFMGDSGSLVIGFLLGVLTVRTTFLPPGRTGARAGTRSSRR